MTKNCFIFGFILFTNIVLIKCDFFTALSDMEKLVQIEESLIINLKFYISSARTKLKFLENEISKMENANLNVQKNLTNPIDHFTITRRLQIDFNEIKNVILRKDLWNNIREMEAFLPTENDLYGSVEGLIRLMEVYHLNASDLANGIINGIQYGLKMSVFDTYELAIYTFLNRRYIISLEWIIETIKNLEESKMEIDVENRYYFLLQGLFVLFKDIELYDPSNEVLTKNLNFLHNTFKPVEHMPLPGYFIQYLENKKNQTDVYPRLVNKLQKYEQLCRKEIQPSPATLAPLRCRYVDYNQPFLKIAPFKMEELSLSPYMVQFHNALSEYEIESLKLQAKPILDRATVTEKLESKSTKQRIAKFAWLMNATDPMIIKIDQRVKDMTGLEVSTGESLQVLNYGIGGHYEPHYDHANKNQLDGFGNGNRIATYLFYLSDVEAGGGTAFPEINLTIWPIKGSAVFWHNLYASGEPDNRTLHAACPVLVGDKWICNKWLREYGQEFLRPCKLYPDHPL